MNTRHGSVLAWVLVVVLAGCAPTTPSGTETAASVEPSVAPVASASPSETTTAGPMWPQTTLEEIRQAQELADAGDPRYMWQVEPQIEAVGGPRWFVGDSGEYEDAEIVARFLREELGWEEFRFNEYVGWEGYLSNMTYVRCEPGGTNALYPDDPYAGGCAPTIDGLRYETVHFDLTQPGREGPSGIWVVSNWSTGAPFAQSVPPIAEAEALLEEFLQARIDGEGAERYIPGYSLAQPPLLYATTARAPYERYEYELSDGPYWPFGGMGSKVRLYAEGGETVVEQLFDAAPDAGGLELTYQYGSNDDPPTTENGEGVPFPYTAFDGEVTYAAAWPWRLTWANYEGLLLDEEYDERVVLVAYPLPATDCPQDAAPADAEALDRSIRSDPDLEATAPVATSVGGIPALRMDVVLAPGASDCDPWADHQQVGLQHGERMRLYLLDAPQGSSIRILAIAIAAPEARFEEVVEAAAHIVDSIEFRTG